ncbi:MAG: P-loop ATPase [Prevotellaceae bacterium]|nr:P-loop ATPase [Prevotellaceae bacterium]
MDALSYLESRCSLRRNVLTGEISYAPHRSNDYKPLSKEGINTLILEAGRDGVALTETLINRYVNSTLVERWNPAEAWLSTLGEWDGEDHVYNLSQRIITSNPDWGKRFHKWMLQMVARWAGCEVKQRDVMMPVLVGQFGFGKTTFCSLLLPPELRNYYSGSVHLKSSAEVQELVTGNLLINMDEFYQDNTEQRYLARYLFSRSTPVFRQPYGVTTEPRRNYAALIATTGNLHPMTDAAGAAHLVCVEVERPIDLKTPIPYEQLYAQLKAELDTGVDFALTEEDREAMAVQNSPFQEADNLVKMVRLLYASPAKGKKAKAVYIDTIIDRLMQEYPYWTPGKHVNQDVGFALQEAGFTRSRIHGRSAYRIVPRDPRRFDFVEEVPAQEQETFDNNPLAKALLAGLGGLVKK